MTDFGGKRCVVGGDGTATAVDLTPADQTQRTTDTSVHNSTITASQAEDTRQATYLADTERSGLLDQLRTATATQINTYVDNNIASTNVTTLRNECRAMFKRIIKLMALNVQR